MTSEQITKIEAKLGISLPVHYVTFLMNFAGLKKTDTLDANFFYEDFIYATPEHIIEINEMMGFHLNDKIVKNKLIIGDNGGGDYYLIDLKDHADKKVYYLDHEESIENNFNEKTNTWNWDGLECYETLDNYKKEIEEMFGPE